MPKFCVALENTVTYTIEVTVEADTSEQAKQKALDLEEINVSVEQLDPDNSDYDVDRWQVQSVISETELERLAA